MPMSKSFQERLFPVLPAIIDHFGSPFHIYDEQGIMDNASSLIRQFREAGIEGFQEFFAVKANPNPRILKIMLDCGFGVDCSSPLELFSADLLRFPPERIMFTSNNTSRELLERLVEKNRCILNLDDITMIDKPSSFPELICFRYNPGERRTGNQIIGNPVEAKYGVRHDQIVEAYQRAMARGAKRFGLHTMIISNQLDWAYMAETIKMELDVVDMVSKELGIQFEFINMGGGIGIPYRPEHQPFDIVSLVKEDKMLLGEFKKKHGYAPKLFMECGRYMAGPYGVLVAKVINVMEKYRKYVGINAATMAANPRPAIYKAYHHVTILDSSGNLREGDEELVDVVGPLCENSDKFAENRLLPKTQVGDIMVQHDTGAHAPPMGSNYNWWLRPKELILLKDGTVELTRREDTFQDLIAPYSCFETPEVFWPGKSAR